MASIVLLCLASKYNFKEISNYGLMKYSGRPNIYFLNMDFIISEYIIQPDKFFQYPIFFIVEKNFGKTFRHIMYSEIVYCIMGNRLVARLY